MERDCWWVIAESNEVRPGVPLALTRFGEKLVLWRDRDGRVACAVDRCPHRSAALSTGRVVDGCIECFFHGFRFDASGACTKIPAHDAATAIPKALRVQSYETREAMGFVFVFWGARRQSYPPVPSFDVPNDSFAYHTLREDWPQHYSRTVENQLDFTHLPFTHATTIGRGVPERLDVLTEVNGDRILARYDPKTYDAGEFFVELHAPNLWRNRLSKHVWGVAAFAPVDDANTRIYVRFYQDFVTAPLLGQAACWLANVFNRIILSQDRARVVSQRVGSSALGMDEVLVPSDLPIIEYRRWRKRKQDELETISA